MAVATAVKEQPEQPATDPLDHLTRRISMCRRASGLRGFERKVSWYSIARGRMTINRNVVRSGNRIDLFTPRLMPGENPFHRVTTL